MDFFSILISNTDRPLRNHGLSWDRAQAWPLSSAYDRNPVPAGIKQRVLSTAITLPNGTASLNLALEVAEYFEVDRNDAGKIAAEVGAAVARWRSEGAKLGLAKSEMDRMTSAFEHGDLKEARTGHG